MDWNRNWTKEEAETQDVERVENGREWSKMVENG